VCDADERHFEDIVTFYITDSRLTQLI